MDSSYETPQEAQQRIENERIQMMTELFKEPEFSQCKMLKSWRTQNLLDLPRLSKISGIPRDLILKFENGKYASFSSDQVKTALYLITHDRRGLKRRWPLKKSTVKNYKRHQNPTFFGVEFNVGN